MTSADPKDRLRLSAGRWGRAGDPRQSGARCAHILEPVFEADFQPGSYGYRPKRTAHDAIKRVAEAIVQRKTRVLDFDLRAYFDNVRHDRLLTKWRSGLMTRTLCTS
jgi:Reverse transcriptase (RNA-dependent DNA polymerase)